MAGGFGQKSNLKSKVTKHNSSEIIKDSPTFSNPINNLSGILSPGESVDFSHSEKTISIDWNREFLSQSVNQEQALFVNQHHQEIQQEIKDILGEIKKLQLSTENLDHEIVQALEQNIPEANEYQLNFLQRIKNLIIQFRQNINQSCVWLESFNHKKSRKNAFWGKVHNKKSGGEQYLFSGEHSSSRSAN